MGFAGDDTLEIAGTGIKAALYANNIADYTVVKDRLDGPDWYVAYNVSGQEGTDTLLGFFEKLEFADFTVNLTVQDRAESRNSWAVTRLEELYIAFFNRIPEADGLELLIGVNLILIEPSVT